MNHGREVDIRGWLQEIAVRVSDRLCRLADTGAGVPIVDFACDSVLPMPNLGWLSG